MNASHPIITIDLVRSYDFKDFIQLNDPGHRPPEHAGCAPRRPPRHPLPPSLRHREADDGRHIGRDYTRSGRPGYGQTRARQGWRVLARCRPFAGQAGPGLSVLPRCIDTRLTSMSRQIVVTFSEKKPKKSWFPVYAGEVHLFLSPFPCHADTGAGGCTMGAMVGDPARLISMLLTMMEGLSKSKCDNPSSSVVRQLYVLRAGYFSAPYPQIAFR
jgi:hypothetical protein